MDSERVAFDCEVIIVSQLKEWFRWKGQDSGSVNGKSQLVVASNAITRELRMEDNKTLLN
jgi:hypothetical protein